MKLFDQKNFPSAIPFAGICILDYYNAGEIKEKVLDYMYPWTEENAARLLQNE